MVPNLQVGAEGAPDLPDAALGDPDAALLAAIVAELEALSRFDGEEAARRAQQAIDAARALGLEELELRAQLVQADMVRRRGDIAQAGRVAQDVRRWAADHGCDHLLARSHFLLAAVFQELGDLSVALEHAVQAVDLLDDDALPPCGSTTWPGWPTAWGCRVTSAPASATTRCCSSPSSSATSTAS